MGMTERDLERISPRSFNNKLNGFKENEQVEWIRARFIALNAANAGKFKIIKESDLRFSFEKNIKRDVSLPTKEDIERMDKILGRKI